jgi:hypothetical protein
MLNSSAPQKRTRKGSKRLVVVLDHRRHGEIVLPVLLVAHGWYGTFDTPARRMGLNIDEVHVRD